MPSSTPRQQHFMQMVHAFQMGHLHTKDLPPGVREKVKKTAKSMTKKASGEFAAKVEESTELTEISKATLGSYITKAAAEKADIAKSMAWNVHKDDSTDEALKKAKQKRWLADIKKGVKRTKGIATAVSKLVKEEDDIDFASLSFVEFMQMEAALIEAFSELTEHEFDALVEKWAEEDAVNPAKKGMFEGKTKAELESELAALKKTGPHKKGSKEYTKEKELMFAIRAKSGWGNV